MRPVLQMWATAISSGYAESNVWMAWADDVIMRTEKPESWVIDMSINPDAEALGQRLHAAWDTKGGPANLINHRKLHLGYRFALLRSGRITLDDFSNETWTRQELDDAYEEFFPEVFGRWFADLGEADESDRDVPPLLEVFRAMGHQDQEFIRAAQMRFGPLSDEAEEQFQYLTTHAADDIVNLGV